jgi:hypothetical protein
MIKIIGALVSLLALMSGIIFWGKKRYDRKIQGLQEQITGLMIRITADQRTIRNMGAEINRLAEMAKKTEAVKNEQINDRDKISTGDPAGDFAGSVNVLSKRARARTGN